MKFCVSVWHVWLFAEAKDLQLLIQYVDVDEDGFLTLSEFLELIQQTLGQGFIMFHQSSGWFHGVMNPIDKGCAKLICPDAINQSVNQSIKQTMNECNEMKWN